jgi:hypothetical protein
LLGTSLTTRLIQATALIHTSWREAMLTFTLFREKI